MRLARRSPSGSLAPPRSRLSVTDMSWNTKRSDGIIAMPALTLARESWPVTSLPSNVMRPPKTWLMPRMVRIVVLLPLPLWPRMPRISPACDREVDVEHDLLAAVAGLQVLDDEHRRAVVAVGRRARRCRGGVSRFQSRPPRAAGRW